MNIHIHPTCLAGNHVGVDLYTDPDDGLVANQCGVCWPESAT